MGSDLLPLFLVMTIEKLYGSGDYVSEALPEDDLEKDAAYVGCYVTAAHHDGGVLNTRPAERRGPRYKGQAVVFCP